MRVFGPTTAYPAPLGMAASFDRDLLQHVGIGFGRDARARGVDFLLGPGINIYRVPMNGRNFEYYGEDPYLSGEMATAFVKGVQSEGVIATVKHYAANNQENDRTGTSSDVDERTLREIYLPAFEAAVKKGGAWSIMVSYNLVNGTYASENDRLVNQVLKKEWGFKGVVMSDWGATHSTVNAANHGLDLEMPSGVFFNKLGPAVGSGEVKESVIDDKVRRLFRATMAIGAWGRKNPTEPATDDPVTGAIALDAAREGIVLLKNKGNLLPLTGMKRIAVIGPNADPTVIGGGGSAYTTPFHSTSALEAIKARAGSSVSVDYAPGPMAGVMQALAKSTYTELSAEYFTNVKLEGQPVQTRRETRIDLRRRPIARLSA